MELKGFKQQQRKDSNYYHQKQSNIYRTNSLASPQNYSNYYQKNSNFQNHQKSYLNNVDDLFEQKLKFR
jgi:hypothetical protein